MFDPDTASGAPATAPAETTPLDDLAGRIAADQAPPPGAPGADAAAAEAAQLQAMLAGLGRFADKALRAVRARMSRRLPELLDHWTDDDLRTFSDAVPPVAAKWLGKLGPLIGSYPEESALAFAALPLVVGYVSAVTAHDANTARTLEAPAAPVAVPTAPASNEPVGTPVFHVG